VSAKRLYAFIVFAVLSFNLYGQSGLTVGKQFDNMNNFKGAFYDLSDPSGVNMRVGIWGNIQFPGTYLVSERASVMDIISYAGGLSASAELSEMKILRMKADSSYEVIKFNYSELLWKDDLKNFVPAPKLAPGDLIIIPGEPRLFWREYLTLGLSVISTILSITLSIIYITN